MSNIEEILGKPRLFVSFLEYGRHVGQLRRRRRAYAPTTNTASHDNHEEINSWVSFSFPCMMSGGLRLAALRAAGAPLLIGCDSFPGFARSFLSHLVTFKLSYFPILFSFDLQFMLTLMALFISAKQQTCPTGEVWCGDWKCILTRKVCDGTEDCSNGRDEKNCSM